MMSMNKTGRTTNIYFLNKLNNYLDKLKIKINILLDYIKLKLN